MNPRKIFHVTGAGAVVLGLALCVPSAMLAQSGASSQDSSGMSASQSNSAGTMAMHHHRRRSAKHQLKQLTKELNLTPEQQQQMLPILQDQHKKMKAMKEDTSLSPQQRREQARTTMQDTHQKLEAIMTDSQKQQFEQTMQQRREHWQNHHHRMNNGMEPGSAGTPPPQPQS